MKQSNSSSHRIGLIAAVVSAIAGVVGAAVGIVSLIPQHTSEPTLKVASGSSRRASDSGLPSGEPAGPPLLAISDDPSNADEIGKMSSEWSDSPAGLMEVAPELPSCDGPEVSLLDGSTCYSRAAKSGVSVRFSYTYGKLRPILTISPESGAQIIKGFVGPGKAAFATSGGSWELRLTDIDAVGRTVKLKLMGSHH